MEGAASGDVIPFQFRYHRVAERVALREHPVPDILDLDTQEPDK